MPTRNVTSFTGSINRPAVQNRVFIPQPPHTQTYKIVGDTPVISVTPPFVSTGLVLWLNASSLPTGALSSWNDDSGNSRTLTQGTVGSQPTVVAAASPTGLNAVRFDGTNDWMSNTLPFPTNAGWTFFAAHKPNSPTTGTYLMLNGKVNGVGFMISNTGTNRELILRNVADVIDGAVTNNAEIWQGDGINGGNANFRVNNGTPVVSANAAASATIQMTLGIYETLTGTTWPGDVYEIIAYNRQLTGTEITSVHDYLRTKWITGPTSTPYIGWGWGV